MVSVWCYRALTLGLSVDDVVAVDSFIDDLKSKKNSGFSTSAQIKTATEIRELKLRVSVSTTSVYHHVAPSLSVVTHRSLLYLDILWPSRVSPYDCWSSSTGFTTSHINQRHIEHWFNIFLHLLFIQTTLIWIWSSAWCYHS